MKRAVGEKCEGALREGNPVLVISEGAGRDDGDAVIESGDATEIHGKVGVREVS